MKNTLTFIIALLLLSCKEEPQKKKADTSVEKDTTSYQLVWQDEFDIDKLDSSKWNLEEGFVRNQEKQYYTDRSKNLRIKDGILILEAHKEQLENQKFVSSDANEWKENQKYAQYSAASITTKDLEEWTYGKIEVRAKLPKGKGVWPAIWMLGKNWDAVGWPECGEIDIMEHVGYDKDSIYGTVHTTAFNHTKDTEVMKAVFIEKPYSEFHDYAVEWTPERIDFMLDGKKYHEFVNTGNGTAEWPFDQAFHLKLNLAIGGFWGGRKGIDDTVFPQQMHVDFVRVYQLK